MNPIPPHQLEDLASKLTAVGIPHKYSPGEDDEEYDMIGEHWSSCREFLLEARNKGGKVVVHCAAGMNRSAVIACAAHMILEREPVLDVVHNCVDKRRGFVLSNRSFRRQLCLLAAAEGLLGQKPAGFDDDPIEKAITKPPPKHALWWLT
eukprot:CAMPEP_0183307294 /NCGR_PEP_ID=MMETSP0160_2-20130417/17245_1 /TAXON_ID=2839 ORGANISM="Odontella Sinensis, Strain Grunow 1884" /NCGR_SAMPLE_ID=MMETSP0160_2 /ASSEMBLY_ACC=CAM_ASM_000250 /LENGTH=149 /DNA_ID=CAMNT_0025470849 /DNA_START=244 /DNA_END=693 /DNA_ORIENTATION=+